MADDVFRQTRKTVNPDDPLSNKDPLESVRNVQKAVASNSEEGFNSPLNTNPPSPKGIGAIPPQNPDAGVQFMGNMPPEFKKALEEKAAASSNLDQGQFSDPNLPAPTPAPKVQPPVETNGVKQDNIALDALLQRLADDHTWERLDLPSKGKFYKNIPPSINIRPMTGEEEQILATPRFTKKGVAIDMIFEKCIRENIKASELLSIDRNYILIFLRGISYTPQYEVEVKCPSCGTHYSDTIELDSMEVESCPDSFSIDSLNGILPKSGFKYEYHLATGGDEQEVTTYREQRVKAFGGQANDDTLLHRTALLLDNIEGITNKKEIKFLLQKLPILDLSHLRNVINDPPFGVDTDISMLCPSCSEEFKIDLPLEVNFFFPRKKTAETQA